MLEQTILMRIRARFDQAGYLGDDAAVLKLPGEVLVSADALVEGSHFRLGWSSLADVGYKAMAVNASDMAAMGSRMDYALLSLGLPHDFGEAELEALLNGMDAARRDFPYTLIGGDLFASPHLSLNVTALGAVVPPVLHRQGARAGEKLFVTGRLGESALGLGQLEGRWQLDATLRETALQRHLRPLPRVEWMRIIRQTADVSAAMDLSDGLLVALEAMAETCGLQVDVDALPLADRARHFGPCVRGGEDYEILFTALDVDQERLLRQGVIVTEIGWVTTGTGVQYSCNLADVPPAYEPFAGA